VEELVTFDPDHRPDLETLASAIARSQIVVSCIFTQLKSQPVKSGRFPAGFEDVDIAILDWIAAEGRRAARRYLPI
jgi:hypothetical protein